MNGGRDGLVARTASPDQTRALAAALAELARPSDLVVLVGDLGAGKTAFTQGFGLGLGVDEQITSPTFALVRSYTGRLDMYHLDVYRLEQVAEALDLGLSELLDDGSVTLEVEVTNRRAFRTFVLGLLEHAEIVSPPELRDDLVEWLEATIASRGAV